MTGEINWRELTERLMNPPNNLNIESDPEEDPIEAPMDDPMGYHPGIIYEGVDDINESDEDNEEENQHDMELLEAEEDVYPGEADENEEEEEAPDVEQIIQEMEEEEAEQEELIVSIVEEARERVETANARVEVLERRWLDEAEKSFQLQLQLDHKEAEMDRLKAELGWIKGKCCISYYDLHKRIEKYPSEEGDPGYDINRSVVISMINKAYNEAKKW